MSDDRSIPWTLAYDGCMSGNIAAAISELEAFIAKDDRSAFKSLVGHQFSNSHSGILARINEFIDLCEPRFDLRSVYLEMNGFDINPDRWYFDCFGYETYNADVDDLEWLCYWQSPDFPDTTLTGLEAVQEEFDWYHREEIYQDGTYELLYDYAMCLVMTKFVLFVGDSVRSGTLKKQIPILATAHDFDSVGRFEVRPGA